MDESLEFGKTDRDAVAVGATDNEAGQVRSGEKRLTILNVADGHGCVDVTREVWEEIGRAAHSIEAAFRVPPQVLVDRLLAHHQEPAAHDLADLGIVVEEHQ